MNVLLAATKDACPPFVNNIRKQHFILGYSYCLYVVSLQSSIRRSRHNETRRPGAVDSVDAGPGTLAIYAIEVDRANFAVSRRNRGHMGWLPLVNLPKILGPRELANLSFRHTVQAAPRPFSLCGYSDFRLSWIDLVAEYSIYVESTIKPAGRVKPVVDTPPRLIDMRFRATWLPNLVARDRINFVNDLCPGPKIE